MLLLDYANFGRLQAQSIRATEAFRAEARLFVARIHDLVRAVVPFEPDSNLVCLAMNPCGNTGLRTMNRFMRRLHHALSADPDKPLQLGEYFGSITTLKPDAMGPADTRRLLSELGFAEDAICEGDEETDRIVILRHTLMNPFLLDDSREVGYLAGYFDFLGRLIAELLAMES
ncbi:MAG: hypothetical protein E6Q88_13425 [Lysobacteraceae bacterium]|nr:MAG: hypothetical protein E6Q88_13425 [Xanthomonadaceae bacterium]